MLTLFAIVPNLKYTFAEKDVELQYVESNRYYSIRVGSILLKKRKDGDSYRFLLVFNYPTISRIAPVLEFNLIVSNMETEEVFRFEGCKVEVETADSVYYSVSRLVNLTEGDVV